MTNTRKILKIEEFDIPIYGGKVTAILFLNNWEKVIEYLKKEGFDTKEYETWKVLGLQFSQFIKGKRRSFILIEDNKDKGDTAVHELFHLTQDILEYRGVNFIKEDGNEAYAYLIGYLFSKVEKLLK